MAKLTWYKNKDAPIPDYYCHEASYRIFKSQGLWRLQQLEPVRQTIDYFLTFKEAKKGAEIIN